MIWIWMSEVEFGGKSFSVDEMKSGLDPPQRRMLFISESTICFLPEIVVIVVIVDPV